MVKVKFLILSLLLIISSFLYSPLNAEPVKFEMISESSSIQKGTPFWLALDLTLEEGWHAYWKNPGDAGIAPQIEWTLPDFFKILSIEWPSPSKYSSDEVETYGYQDQAILLVKILPGENFNGTFADIKAEMKWVVCSDETCLPGSGDQELHLNVTSTNPTVTTEMDTYFTEARSHLPKKTYPVRTRIKDSITECVIDLKGKINGFSGDMLKDAVFFSEKGKSQVALSPHPDFPSYAVFTFDSSQQESEKGVLVAGGVGYDINLGDDSKKPADLVALNSGISNKTKTSESLPIDEDRIDNFATALLFAFVGGMLLNLMPCVLPVISLKVLSFVKMAGKSRFETFKQGLMFSLGVLVSFWFLAGLLLILQAWGHAIGWGFQLQEPIFVAILAVVVVLFALNLFGVFEMGTLFASWAGNKEVSKKEGSLSSFFSGVFATAIATPCTGPFLGSAVGYAFTIPSIYALIVFTFLGLGMAFPYLILTAFPSLLRFVPKPGKWMETFKQSMGFMMLLAALWLTWVFSGETEDPAVVILLAAYIAIGVGAWALGKWSVPYRTIRSRLFGAGVALTMTLFATQAIWMASNLTSTTTSTSSEIASTGLDTGWEPFSVRRLEALRASGTPVFIDFTAKWCLVCQTNHMILSADNVASKMKEKGVVKMKADWTKNDPAITAELQKWGRRSVPLYLLYVDNNPKILPQVLTKGGVIAELEQIKKY